MAAITFTIYPPSAALLRDVEGYRIAESGGGEPMEVKTCPNGRPGLVFHSGAHGSAIESLRTRSDRIDRVPPLFLHGQGSEPSVMAFTAHAFVSIQVVLRPWALYSLFGLNSSGLSLGFLPAADFGADGLENHLLGAQTTAARLSLLDRFLLDRSSGVRERDTLIEDAVAHIEANVSTVTVGELAATLHLSERQLQRRFSQAVGGSPQQYLRVKRVNEALRLMKTGRYERLSDVASAMNFYDQSHFIREMKALSWVTPRDITQKVTEFNHDIGGVSFL